MPIAEEQGYQSDSTLTSSVSIDLLQKRPLSDRLHRIGGLGVPKRLRTTKKYTKTIPKGYTSYKLGQKRSLIHCLEKQSLLNRKRTLFKQTACLSQKHQCPKHHLLSKSDETSDFGGSGDHSCSQRSKNQHKLYPAVLQQPASQEFPDQHGFPFKNTPSGHYKLEPSQVVYESKNLSILAADPKSVTLNITESSQQVDSESAKKNDDNWPTTCLYTSVGPEAKIPFNSELSDSVSESEAAARFVAGKSPDQSTTEFSLAKMGYVTDNCVEWKKLVLPKKSDLQNILMQKLLGIVNPDIEIKIGNGNYKCHKVVLECYCTYFSSRNSLEKIELPESSMSGEVFFLIYQWMLQPGTDSYELLKRDNILDIFKAAQFLGIKELEDQCWAFIDNTDIFSEDQAFLLYLQARKHNNKDIMELMVPRVQRFFLTLVSSKEFVELSVEEVCVFLSSNYICIHCEMEVLMAGVRWLSHDWQTRMQHSVQVMRCVRFGLINPRLLITVRRNPQSPELMRIANIPDISNMIEDGLALAILKTYLENEPDEEFQKSLKSLGLKNTTPRNWAGLDKDYQTYKEFLQDLALYRSKQRLEIKRSKMELEIENEHVDDFLSSAVLPPATQQKMKQMRSGKNIMMRRCLPQLEPKELTLLKKMICDDSFREDRSRQMKSKLNSILGEENNQKHCFKPFRQRGKTRLERDPPSLEEQDLAAQKIQKAFRSYCKRKSISITEVPPERSGTFGRKRIKTRWISRSNPSLHSTLKVSSLSTGRVCDKVSTGEETVYIFGGSNLFEKMDSNSEGQQIYRYHAESNSWLKSGQIPEPRLFHSVLYFQGMIYVAGGKHPCKILNEPGEMSRKVWRFDPRLQAWCRVRDMLHARRSFGFVVCNNHVFVVGGRTDNNRILANVEKYNVDTDAWTEVRPMLIPRAGLAACEFNSQLWVAGGLINCNYLATNCVECYNYHLNMWIPCKSVRFPLAYAVMLTAEDRLYLVGGALGLPGQELAGSGKQIDLWDPESKSWCLASKMSKARHAHGAVYCRETGKILILGGMSMRSSTVLSSVECWGVKNDDWDTEMAPLPQPLSGLVALCLPPHTIT